ncbi:plasma glutamate carboxypeptidase, putative [Ichthyophthirius multifiliis]|uniref:Carboxypeptidase Q n=1 Tax=Ichthyophthirius multifiliis TaxID=5932 RepID=G0R1P6_ICHMU|nr:plasma glutamate carboxypeptidase, putative [Ichthyophthirius multifiliis]EGR28606.1 plasma glutamate carboxypeptidase, putative [Ichthyophthirius multifiliis]|eukprot:XP_004029842.1 plasma glutamate carboxypeptidase, putative [Ichthyophthirius multifiliis]
MQQILLFLILITFSLSIIIREQLNLKYINDITKIKSTIEDQSSQYHHSAYNRLAYIVDTYGPRLWGSDVLEAAIMDFYQQIQQEKIDVKLEKVSNFTKWERGNENLTLFEPRLHPQKLNFIGLGLSVPGNVTAEAFLVTSFEDLEKNKDKVNGKIVIYAFPWVDYPTTVQFRTSGASYAAKYGAVAVLIRSITPFSINSPHTGAMQYKEKDEHGNPIPKIPAGSITVEDAEMLLRMQKRGQNIRINLYMENRQVPNCESFNVVAELKGTEFPEEIIVLGGHIDSWDVGSQTGANDDGGGFITTFEALRIIQKLGLQPKRTIRFVAWSGEEYGGSNSGGSQYAQLHKGENVILAFENDMGSRTSIGWGFNAKNNTQSQRLKDLLQKYMKNIYGLTKVFDGEGEMVDTSWLGAPMIRNIADDTKDNKYYFTYHHSAGDTMSIMDPDQLDQNVVGIASLVYLVAQEGI